jgi:hypothetical protein
MAALGLQPISVTPRRRSSASPSRSATAPFLFRWTISASFAETRLHHNDRPPHSDFSRNVLARPPIPLLAVFALFCTPDPTRPAPAVGGENFDFALIGDMPYDDQQVTNLFPT